MLLRAALERETLALDIRIYADEIAVFPLALRLLIHLHETALFLLWEKRPTAVTIRSEAMSLSGSISPARQVCTRGDSM